MEAVRKVGPVDGRCLAACDRGGWGDRTRRTGPCFESALNIPVFALYLKGAAVVGVRARDAVVLAVEQRAAAKLQVE